MARNLDRIILNINQFAKAYLIMVEEKKWVIVLETVLKRVSVERWEY